MAAKRVRVSTDNGVNWLTLPGSSGEKRLELANVNDTIFGQDWQSEQPTIGNIMISANSYFKGVSGYTIVMREGGTSTAMTAEAMSLVTGKTYQVTTSAKRMIDYETSVTVSDNGADKTSEVQSIDYLAGTVTFKSTYTPTGPITITGAYLPTNIIAKGRSMTVTQQAAEIDTTCYEDAQANGGWRTYIQGLRTVSMEIGGLYDVVNTPDVLDKLASRKIIMVEVTPDNSTTTVFRGFFKRMSQSQQGNVGALEEQTQQLSLFVPDGALVQNPFNWYFGGASKLSPSVRAVINAWQTGAVIKVQYLGDGSNGQQVDAVVTEATLANTLEGLNEFRFNFRASGAPTDVTNQP